MRARVLILVVLPVLMTGCVLLGIQEQLPVLTPDAGSYPAVKVNVRMTCPDAAAVIHYTLDGTTPTTSSPAFTDAVPITATTTVKAIASREGLMSSATTTVTYTLKSTGFTLGGRLLYNDLPVSGWAKEKPTMYFWDGTDKKSLTDVLSYYDPETSDYGFTNLPLHGVGITMYLSPTGLADIYPGNYQAYAYFDLSSMPASAGLGNDIRTTVNMHLTQPFDNTTPSTAGTYPSYASPVTFQWDPIKEAAFYYYEIYEFDNVSYSSISTPVAWTSTTQTSLSVPLSSTVTGRHYAFYLEAYNAAGHALGWLSVPYTNGGYSSFYYFTVP